MLTYNPDERISGREALEHPWFKNASTKHLDSETTEEIIQNLSKFKVPYSKYN